METNQPVLDAAVIGGGPAGLAAGLWLARYRYRVRILDAERPRNGSTWAVHGYPGLPDLPPAELRRRIRDQAIGAGADYTTTTVTSVRGAKDAFTIEIRDGEPLSTRRVLLAFGRRDRVPEIPGIEDVLGTALFHCPDCDGPSMAGGRVAVIGWDEHAAALALFLLTWTDRIVLLCHGHRPRIDHRTLTQLEERRITTRPETIVRISGHEGRTASVHLQGAGELAFDGLFCHFGSEPASDLASRLGCEETPDGYLLTSNTCETSVPGVYAAGDAAGHPHLAVSAAAQGVHAALALHRSLAS